MVPLLVIQISCMMFVLLAIGQIEPSRREYTKHSMVRIIMVLGGAITIFTIVMVCVIGLLGPELLEMIKDMARVFVPTKKASSSR